MEVKYGKKSGKTLEELKALYEAEMQAREEERKANRYEIMELCGYFHTAQEMIDYVLSGGKIEEDSEGEWMQLIEGCVHYYRMHYNDIDCPIGMYSDIWPIHRFVAWAHRCEEIQKEDGSPFVNEYFHKYTAE
jgi:hypothetical protein